MRLVWKRLLTRTLGARDSVVMDLKNRGRLEKIFINIFIFIFVSTLIFSLAHTYAVYVMYMRCTWGVPVVYMWCTCGVHVVHIWCTCGVHVMYMWCTCVVHVGRRGELKCYRQTYRHTDPPTEAGSIEPFY